jgi:hypothetical protein
MAMPIKRDIASGGHSAICPDGSPRVAGLLAA